MHSSQDGKNETYINYWETSRVEGFLRIRAAKNRDLTSDLEVYIARRTRYAHTAPMTFKNQPPVYLSVRISGDEEKFLYVELSYLITVRQALNVELMNSTFGEQYRRSLAVSSALHYQFGRCSRIQMEKEGANTKQDTEGSI